MSSAGRRPEARTASVISDFISQFMENDYASFESGQKSTSLRLSSTRDHKPLFTELVWQLNNSSPVMQSNRRPTTFRKDKRQFVWVAEASFRLTLHADCKVPIHCNYKLWHWNHSELVSMKNKTLKLISDTTCIYQEKDLFILLIILSDYYVLVNYALISNSLVI